MLVLRVNCLFLLLPCYSFAQQISNTSVLNNAIQTANLLYKQSINEDMQLYYGSSYNVTGHGIYGFPYFDSDTFNVCSISYEGCIYTNVPAIYDIVQDKIIIKDYYQKNLIQLLPEKVDSFSFLQNIFIHINAGTIKKGFYQRLFSEVGMSLYARREKVINDIIKEGNPESAYKQYNYYYLECNGIFYKADNEKAVFDLAKGKEAILKNYVRTYKLNFKTDFEHSLILLTQFYSSIK